MTKDAADYPRRFSPVVRCEIVAPEDKVHLLRTKWVHRRKKEGEEEMRMTTVAARDNGSSPQGEEGRSVAKAMLCGCGRYLEATDDDGLVAEVLVHRGREHPAAALADEEQVRQVVGAHAYKVEYVAQYAGGAGPDEEFGLEPY